MTNFNITTKRLNLRLIKESDFEAIWDYVSDPDISYYMSWEPHTDIGQTKLFVKNAIKQIKKEQCIHWVIEKDKQVCGLTSIIAIKKEHRALIYNRGELAYWLGKEFQGQGIMTEANLSVLQYAFDVMNLHRVCVAHDVNNMASCKLIKSLGFKFLFEEFKSFKKQNRWVNTRYYELLKENYVAQDRIIK